MGYSQDEILFVLYSFVSFSVFVNIKVSAHHLVTWHPELSGLKVLSEYQ